MTFAQMMIKYYDDFLSIDKRIFLDTALGEYCIKIRPGHTYSIYRIIGGELRGVASYGVGEPNFQGQVLSKAIVLRQGFKTSIKLIMGKEVT